MARPSFSRHAEVRMQQRAIPAAVVECLLDAGRRQHDKHGGQVVFFDHRAWRRAERQGFRQRVANFDRYRNTYAVVAVDETVVTVGRRYRRIHRH